MLAALEIRILPASQLIPAPYNPRELPAAAEAKLRKSLEEFGPVEPLVWNESSGRIVGGHARLRLLQELGFTDIPVAVVRLDEVREKALNIVLNNREAQGAFDPERLAEVLGELETQGLLESTGFDAKTLDALRYEPTGDIEPEEAPGDRVEITLECDAETYGRLEGKLNEFVREFDLISHVKSK